MQIGEKDIRTLDVLRPHVKERGDEHARQLGCEPLAVLEAKHRHERLHDQAERVFRRREERAEVLNQPRGERHDRLVLRLVAEAVIGLISEAIAAGTWECLLADGLDGRNLHNDASVAFEHIRCSGHVLLREVRRQGLREPAGEDECAARQERRV